MTGRTHDLAAFTAITIIIVTHHVPHITLATAIVSLSANLIGGLAPDIDQPTADLWHKLPAGTIYGRLITPFLGGHRYLSHSILGIIGFGALTWYLLQLMKSVLLVDMHIVFASFMIGFISHLLMDTITREGVPWLFPIPWHIGIPPIKVMRVKTGGLIEKAIIFPGLILINGYLYYHYAPLFLDLLKHLR